MVVVDLLKVGGEVVGGSHSAQGTESEEERALHDEEYSEKNLVVRMIGKTEKPLGRRSLFLYLSPGAANVDGHGSQQPIHHPETHLQG